MRKSRFAEAQIAYALSWSELDTQVQDICHKTGISDATFYKWPQEYGGLGPSEPHRMQQREEEDPKLKCLVTDLSPDRIMLREVVSKKVVKPSRMREVADDLVECIVLGFKRSVLH